MNIQAIILDFDGTIVESADIKDWGWEALFAEYPKEVREKIVAHHHAYHDLSRYEKFQYITEKILVKPYTPEVEKQLDARYTILTIERIIACPFVHGAEEFLQYFFPRVPLYIVTVNPEDYFRRVLAMRKLNSYFTKIYTSPWRRSDAISDILKKGKYDPDMVLYIGDTYEDYEAAKYCGVQFILRDTGRAWGKGDIVVYKDLATIQTLLAT